VLVTNLTASEYAKYKLIMASIKLFGESGVNSVSLREISRAAGAKNNSALQYHFKNKMGLISAVIYFIQAEFDKTRGNSFSDLEKNIKAGEGSVDEVVSVFINAYVTVIETNDWGHNAVRTLARMVFDGDSDVHEVLNKSAGKNIRSIYTLLETLLPDIPMKTLKSRINFSANAVINGFADHKNLKNSYLGDLAVKNLNQLADSYRIMTIAIISA